jgi:HSP20 family protein
VNIVETSDNFQVEMAIPGMKKEDFVVELDNEILKITGEVSNEEEVNSDDRFIRKEFNYRSFERTFHLPKTVIDQSKINAKYDDGILKLTIPKKEEAKALPPRRIAIG